MTHGVRRVDRPSLSDVELEFSAPLIYWRGPAPFHFVAVPEVESAQLEAVAPLVSYGWGMVPVTLVVGATEVTTALWPKDGGYLVPVKDLVRRAESLQLDDLVHVRLRVSV